MKALIRALGDCGIQAVYVTRKESSLVDKHIVQLPPDQRLSQVLSLEKELEMRLGDKVRIVKNWEPKNTIGIEMRRKQRKKLSWREPDPKFLDLFLGYTFGNTPVSIALEDMPHILIGGATNAGKSVLLRSIVKSILTKHHKIFSLVVVDPKMVEFIEFAKSKHLMTKPIVDLREAVVYLSDICKLIQYRYTVFAKNRVKNILQYNSTTNCFFNYITVIIDEFADLMFDKDLSKKFSKTVQRIAQIGRAAGIHLILATQRPCVKVMTGEIKANIPCRIALRTSTATDSRIILDATGADKLFGEGDALISIPGQEELVRFQTVLV